MKLYYPDTPNLPLPDGHRFPAGKYRLLKDMLVRDGIVSSADLFPSPLAARSELLRAHSVVYVDSILQGTVASDAQRRIGLPWSEVLVERSRAAVGGSLAAARAALLDGNSGQLAGGTHHAHAEFGSGFCVFNDLAVAALTLLDQKAVNRIAILDVDVHQGDGTAAILGRRTDVLTVSVHGEKNFPFRKVPSHLDIGLPDGTGDGAYLAALSQALNAVEAFRPDLVLYLAGVDPLASDTLGRLALSFDGLELRDRAVFDFCRRRGIPCSIAAGGGYARPISDTVEAYANTIRAARDEFRR